jgi:hypothetical protein
MLTDNRGGVRHARGDTAHPDVATLHRTAPIRPRDLDAPAASGRGRKTISVLLVMLVLLALLSMLLVSRLIHL